MRINPDWHLASQIGVERVTLKSVLIIDDDPLQVEVLRHVFECANVAHVHTFADGAAVIRHLRDSETAPDLIISDLQMPEIDGVELMSFLKLDHAHVPLLIISGASQSTVSAAERLSVALGLNVLGALTKPIDEAALQLHIQAL